MRRLALYCVGGGLAVTAHYAVLIVLVEFGAVRPLIATTLGFLTAVPINFAFQRTLVFAELNAPRRRFVRYCIVTALTFLLNGLIFAILTDALAGRYLLAQVLTTGIILGVNYQANAFWTFRKIVAQD
ncbi:MAG: GtrA family protein [Pseudomonadales bacterium]